MISMNFKPIYKITEKLKKFVLKKKSNHSFTIVDILLNLIYYIAGKDLKRKSAKCKSLRELVELALSYSFSLFKLTPPLLTIASLQLRSELYEFSKFIIKLKPKIILEIGTANGGTLFLLSKLSQSNSLIISIDLPGYPSLEGIDYKSELFFKSFTNNNQQMFLIQGNSHDHRILENLKQILKNKKIDLLFIDGDHTYEGVKKDFEEYGALVRENGVIAFHDIVEVTIDDDVEVNKFWKEIKEIYKHEEFVEDWNQDNCGIGVIFKT